ncbi:MAG: hypothetical protein A4E19_19350 [Nitrospira sp. SG-bin1]|nr:MAG: hypothetical protein A4E19_19350 [Nitrospira sp. SG-bin1]
MALSLAHALEFPGKRRLTKETYEAVQPVYYPGFTIGSAVGEVPGGLMAIVVLLLFTPKGTLEFWLTLVALMGLIGMHTVYWIFTHPINKVWIKNERLGKVGFGFFSFGKQGSELREMDWTELRDRWEYSHVARAVLAMVSFIALVTAVAL